MLPVISALLAFVAGLCRSRASLHLENLTFQCITWWRMPSLSESLLR
jgi:hypothetical protein